ncbi:MAG: SagB/ThcOx family dehydrogenase [Rubrivivax sp.]
MPKVLWVALPLLIAAAVLAAQALRGRAPSRHAINVAASVLLLVYVATTAGLGIFWVANQQLPVFDWHYLFGYGTVLLVSLHLAFNFPVVWRFFVRRRTTAAATTPTRSQGPPREARRGVIGVLGVIATTGGAFMLGLRSGRSELKIEVPRGGDSPAGTAASDPAAPALALVERFHAFSSHSRAGVLTRAPTVDWGEPPAPFKGDAGARGMRLPPPGATRVTTFDLGALADILWHTSGVTETRGGLHLRASPSSGALFSTELYVAVRALPGLAPGLWHYDAQSHALAPMGNTAAGALLPGAVADDAFSAAPALVVATAIFRRTGHKYGDRSYRYVLADLGHALENLRVTAGALGVSTRFIAAFDESRAAQALGLDEAEEGVLAVVALGALAAAAEPTASTPPRAAAPLGEASRWLAPSPAASGAALGVTAAVHAATSLRMASAPSPASTPTPVHRPLAQALTALPPAASVAPDWLAVIAKRRSVRRYTKAPLSLPVLADVLARMSALHGPVLSAAVGVNLVAHEVAGLAPGAYRYEPERHALVPRRVPSATRAAARAAALDQDVVADAAVVFVLSIDRAMFAADPLGPARGYRHAFLEAGFVGERVYLEAGARGLGACAVGAFYDDEAAALVGVDPAREWVVHFAALGVKA